MASDPRRTHWYESELGRARLERDQAIIADDQPYMRYEVQPDGAMWLVGDFLLETQSGIPHRIPTVIEFPRDYPRHEPIAHDITSRFQHDADHHFIGDRACLWLKPVESKWQRNDPDALQTFLDELLIFYFRQLAMENDPAGGYPGPARAHGFPPAYVEVLTERLRIPRAAIRRMRHALAGSVRRSAPCPCGSGMRYRECHRSEISRFLSEVPPEQLTQLVAYLAQSPENAA